MGQVRWVGWTMATVTALVIGGGQAARADIESDKPAAVVIYPDIKVNPSVGVDTVIRLTNTNQTNPILVHCYYVDANSHCSGGTADGAVCTTTPGVCTGLSFCVPGWQETDFRIQMTPNQPIEWKASDGLADSCPAGNPTCTGGLPLPTGFCKANPSRPCGVDGDCNPFPGGSCSQSNAGTRIPPVPETNFTGELRCIAIDATGTPVARNDLKGEAILEASTLTALDVASYNAIGVQATGASDGVANQLTLGGPNPEYNGCPNYLILNHFFDTARDPIPGTNNTITTNLVLVPCSNDYLRQIPGLAVAQYLVFNEFEQRFSTSKAVRCFQDIQLCNIDTLNCGRSIWNVSTEGTLTGQTRINPIGVSSANPPGIASGLLGVAVETHTTAAVGALPAVIKSAAFNLHMQGSRDAADVITIP